MSLDPKAVRNARHVSAPNARSVIDEELFATRTYRFVVTACAHIYTTYKLQCAYLGRRVIFVNKSLLLLAWIFAQMVVV